MQRIKKLFTKTSNLKNRKTSVDSSEQVLSFHLEEKKLSRELQDQQLAEIF